MSELNRLARLKYWEDKSDDFKSQRMSHMAKRKHEQLSPEQKRDNALRMVEAKKIKKLGFK